MFFGEQLQNIVNAIKSAGWQVKIESTDTSQMPVDIIAINEEQTVRLRLYTWAIVRSGRRGERKINWRYLPFRTHHRETGDALRIELREDAYNLLVGQWSEKGALLFALFDPFIHQEHIEASPIQIKSRTLELARQKGFSYQFKNTGDIALVFYPKDLMQIVLGLYRLVFEGANKQEVAEKISGILESTDPVIEDEVFPDLDKREKMVALRAIRDPSFRNRVLEAYKLRCAMCGLDLEFVTAAHIISVGQGGTDETGNGIALCPNHHEAFDLGLIGFNEDYQVIVNVGQANALIRQGKANTLRKFLSNLRNELILPQGRNKRPASRYVPRALDDRGITNYTPLVKWSRVH